MLDLLVLAIQRISKKIKEPMNAATMSLRETEIASRAGQIPNRLNTAPPIKAPTIPTPDTWNQAIRGDVNSSRSDISGWWRRFHDPTLNKLIGLAAAENRDLVIAAKRRKVGAPDLMHIETIRIPVFGGKHAAEIGPAL